MVHYRLHIENFGAPNGLCSSITESKHIVAVKKPWRRSNRYEALGQMIKTNERLDKLAAARVDFTERGMLEGSCLWHEFNRLTMLASGDSIENSSSNNDSDDDDSDTDTDSDDSDTDSNDDNSDGHSQNYSNHSAGEDDGGNDCGPVDGPPIYNEVVLAKRRGKL